MIWIGQARSQNVTLSGPILMEKADSLAKKLYTASLSVVLDGWTASKV